MAEACLANDRPRRENRNLMTFTDQEKESDDETVIMPPPKTRKTKKPSNKQDIQEIELEIEKEKLALEREKFRLEIEEKQKDREHQLKMRQLELEIEKAKIEKPETVSNSSFKIKLQTYDYRNKEDIITYLSEFEAISEQAKWTEEMKILQLRILLTGEAREVAQQAGSNYQELRRALIDRFGEKSYEYFNRLYNIQKNYNETYRGLMARIDQWLMRFIDDRDPRECFREEFFLKALHPDQAQWVRRNKGSGSVVEAAEDYIMPRKQIPSDMYQQLEERTNGDTNNARCFKCRTKGHIARDCPNKIKEKHGNPASFFVRPPVGQRLISVPGYVNGREIKFVKDTGTEMTLIREDLADPNHVLSGQSVTLQTAIGEPFTAMLAVVKLNTPYYQGVAQVGLVPGLAAEALLGMDILQRNAYAVTRSQSKICDDGESKHGAETVEREVPHEETGFAPFELLYGWPVRGPTQILHGIFTGEDVTPMSVVDHVVKIRDRMADVCGIVQENLSKRKYKTKAWYDRNTRIRELEPGDEVLILLPSDSSKMKARWKGRVRVVRKLMMSIIQSMWVLDVGLLHIT